MTEATGETIDTEKAMPKQAYKKLYARADELVDVLNGKLTPIETKELTHYAIKFAEEFILEGPELSKKFVDFIAAKDASFNLKFYIKKDASAVEALVDNLPEQAQKCVCGQAPSAGNAEIKCMNESCALHSILVCRSVADWNDKINRIRGRKNAAQ